METEKTKSTSGRGCRRLFNKFILIAIAVLIGVVCFLYFGSYDEGVRSGTIVRISKKGVIFKTYEGQLNLQTFGAMKNSSPFLETFEFSVEGKNTAIVDELQAVSLTGERVSLHYTKRYAVFPWRGKTKYYITDVERIREEGVPSK
ncbi:MAG TPA: hypothetical protein PKH94_08285 [Bacteroidales bacterium]|nr:hypothetical protein [Bacteroidales bacterium]HNS47221.1 hypothetical protein [Bacteroidales bacterium]